MKDITISSVAEGLKEHQRLQGLIDDIAKWWMFPTVWHYLQSGINAEVIDLILPDLGRLLTAKEAELKKRRDELMVG